MAPKGLAILIGAGPTTGSGIARVLARDGNLAVALLARRPEPLHELAQKLRGDVPNSVFEPFSTDTTPQKLASTFQEIKAHESFKGLKLQIAIFSVKHSHRTPFMDETYNQFTESMTTYVGGAFAFAQESLKRFFADHGETSLADGAEKKGTLVFTGTLGALRTNIGYGAYGAGRASVRQLAQSLAREMSEKGVHVVHAIANGGIRDEDSEETRIGKRMTAESVGKTYLWLHEQGPCLWTHELDLRPALEKF